MLSNEILMSVIILLGAFIGMFIALTVFSATIVKSRVKGYIFLVILIAVTINILVSLFEYEPTLAGIITVLYTVLAILSFIKINKTLKGATC